MKKYIALILFLVPMIVFGQPLSRPSTTLLHMSGSTTIDFDADTTSYDNSALAESTGVVFYAAFNNRGVSMAWGNIGVWITAPTDTINVFLSAQPCKMSSYDFQNETVTLTATPLYTSTGADSIVLANNLQLLPNVVAFVPFETRASGLTRLGPCDGYQFNFSWADGGAATADSILTFEVGAQ